MPTAHISTSPKQAAYFTNNTMNPGYCKQIVINVVCNKKKNCSFAKGYKKPKVTDVSNFLPYHNHYNPLGG